MNQQLNLFEQNNQYSPLRPDNKIGREALVEWKQRIFIYQQQAQQTNSPLQTSLFDVAPSHCDPDSIDPFTLKLHSSQFYQMPDWGDAVCIYFIIDNTLPLLLYVGETLSTPKKRWQNHDCRDYIANYIYAHRKHKLEVQVCSAFWWDTPADRKARLKLESELINKFSTPFNKENWQKWGQPFGKI
ncbi:GIY-YIG nuclease family protein [Pleurocapsales cyanobacterium LEGE 06147]|nr:GIY-YIG nuclease family protein [Pleurocapsales cyanobacterium LEGE 06147]